MATVFSASAIALRSTSARFASAAARAAARSRSWRSAVWSHGGKTSRQRQRAASGAAQKKWPQHSRPAPGLPNNVDAVRRALEHAGVVFIDENGGGVNLKAKRGRRT
jgi:hypothetical protein